MTYDSTAERLGQAVTFLFVPGDRPDRFSSAWNSGADAVILDLEASVHPDQKGRARDEVAKWLAKPQNAVLPVVRVNRPESEAFKEDLRSLSGLHNIVLMLSGAEMGSALSEVLLSSAQVVVAVLLVETARGIEQAVELASLAGVARLAFGNMDYETEMGLAPGRWGAVYPASRLAVASRCAGLPAPIAGVTSAIRSREDLDGDIEFERSLGFGAKMCIHPCQVDWARQAYAVSKAELEWAEQILEATRTSHAVAVAGQMIDRPVVERARRTLDRAQGKAKQ
jgi:citrate lyase subunit beta/citryl-CoA lyase